MIPHEYIEEIVHRNKLSDVAGSYVQLRRKGRLYSGLCPFHNEKTPSFYIYPDSETFHCFGCGEGGDVISFIKKINNIGYVEAVKLLAERAGMAAPSEDDKVGKMRSRVLSINKDAARFFHTQLNAATEQGAAARAYWRRRRLDDATIVRFGLGYAPDSFRATYDHLRSRGYTDQELLESGIVKRSEKGNIYDAFRNRVMTPIFDLRGNVIAFGGRVMDDSKPKYINSPETLVYKKSKVIYALQVAKRSADNRYVLCEGYMDVIAMQQAGIQTAVCACGTALTSDQVKLLTDYAEEVILCYDSDEAGQKATVRSLELFKNTSLKIGVLQIPGAKDPDEYIKKYGAERFRALLDGTGNELEFKLAHVRQKYDITQDKDRLDYLKDAINVLAQRSSPTERDVYAGRLTEETGVSKTSILTQLETARKRNRYQANRETQQAVAQQGIGEQIKVPYQAGGQKALGVAAAEQMLLAAIVSNPSYVPFVLEQLSIDDIVLPDLKQIFRTVAQYHKDNLPISVPSLNLTLEENERKALSQFIALHSDVPKTKQDVEMYLERIARSTPKSAIAPQMTMAEHQRYMDELRAKKQ